MKRLACLLFMALICHASQAKDLPCKGSVYGVVVESDSIAPFVVDGCAFLTEHAQAVGSFSTIGKANLSLEWNVSAVCNGHWTDFVWTGCFTLQTLDGSTLAGTLVAWQKCGTSDVYIEIDVREGTGRLATVHGIVPGNGSRSGNQISFQLDGALSSGN